jgi:lysophospholipase L1-like esterase
MKILFGVLFSVGLVAVLAACASAPSVPEGDGPVVAFYGDSYTVGMGASEQSKRWSTIICEDRGWVEFNPSVNGLGFVHNRLSIGEGDVPSLIIEQEPSIVIVTMGLNDNFSFAVAASDIKRQVSADLERFSTQLPDARIIVVEPFWYTDDRPDSVDTIIRWVREAAADNDAEFIAGASRWLEGHPEWMSWDGLHPNDEGYAELATRMDAALADVGL